MAKLYFIALALGSALPALCQDTFCPNGKMIGADIYEYVLDPVNNERKTLLDGNKPNGESGQKLPPPQGMTKLYWNCDLEKEAIDTLAKKCYDHDDPPTTTGDKAKIFDSYFPNRISADSTAVKQLIDSSLQYIDYIELEGVNPGDSSVKYKGDATDSLLPYFTVSCILGMLLALGNEKKRK
ncbi:SCP-like protein [Ancylostoma caninum]|uniref:SCP-like protein n=1 Tax=Ancylostoma caninum TaxID=29170 RepID=A0A368GAM9_ANCCA|nr:SCP-like protein [Ancylostoma caninum]